MSFDPRLTPAREDLAADFLRSAIKAAHYEKGVRRQVVTPQAPLHGTPDASSQMTTELLMGERFTVYEDKDGWSWGQSERDDYVGYVPSASLGATGEAVTHKVAVLRTFIYAGADLKSPVLGAISMGAQVAQTGTEGDFTSIETGGYVFTSHLVGIDHIEPDYLTTAIRFVGAPYLWGGRSSLGLDCSGLVQIALQAAGISCPRDSDMQGKGLGEALDPHVPRLERGDLVFFPGHVGLMIDEGTLLHANAWDMMVSPHPLRYVITEISKKHEQPIMTIRRLA
ncbi:MAG: NlpC/P60 family protein [Proteobacteria bacterium]|nr:NlpC/P60 family protein [Pseudomonadota bacterium]